MNEKRSTASLFNESDKLSFIKWYYDMVDEKFEKYNKLISETPENLGYNEKETLGTIYNTSYNIEFLDKLVFGEKRYELFFSDECHTFFIFDENNKPVADLQMTRSGKDLYILFPWQSPKEKGLMRDFYYYLLRGKQYDRIISGSQQSENAFNMWKKMADDPRFQVSVMTGGNEFPAVSEDLGKYFGTGKANVRFVLKKRIDDEQS